MLFQSTGIEKFLHEIFQPVQTIGDFEKQLKQAISYTEADVPIVKIVGILTCVDISLSEKDSEEKILLYNTRQQAGEAINYQYVNTDGSTTTICIYLREGHTPDAKEKEILDFMGQVLYNVTSRLVLQTLLMHAKGTDLTVGIPNLTAFMDFAKEMMNQGKIEEYSAIYLNIQNFKYVNRKVSYHSGNDVMRQYAIMLQEHLEPDEIVARLGGDNFIALIKNDHTKEFLDFLKSVEVTQTLDGKEWKFELKATIGVSHLKGITDAGEVMMRSSVAYQVAREHEGSAVAFYDEKNYSKIMRQKDISAHFEAALKNGDFMVYYQPKVRTKDIRIGGAEALVRWNYKGNIVSPGEFIPILEKDGRICQLDFYVLDKVCAFLNRLQDEGLPLLKISVNFSRCHMENAHLADDIVAVIDKYALSHKFIEVELTESEDFKDYEEISKLVNELKKHDIATSIDDFGTGYSSLNMLRLAEIDLLKIDRSFVQMDEEFERKFRDIVMLKNIVRMAKELGIQIVAEGVETREQYEYLSTTGCDMMQGYYFDKPLPEEEFIKRLKIGKY
ncbi:MAG: putative bifunctional diguanylate cyclase/phosphodiesterase [Lachnospiraceae bacterium]